MRVHLNTIVRSSVPASVNGQVWLDRSSSEAFATSSTFKDALREFAPGSLRAPTTGHNNLPRSHPMNSRHTYKFGDFTTVVKGNYWDTNYNGPGYIDEDGNPGTGTGLAGAGPISEIVGPVPFSDVHDYLYGLGYSVRIHYFLDWQSGYSEGFDSNGVGGPGGDYQWYADPEPKDINGVDIDPLVAATMTSLDFKKIENRRALKYLKSRGFTDIIINIGGEDWRGWDDDDQTLVPWDILNNDNQDAKYQWISDSRSVLAHDIVDYINEQGWTDVKICSGFLESAEGGRDFPIGANQIIRNNDHVQFDLDNYGDTIDYLGCSMHYRGDMTRWLTEDVMQYSFQTPTGQGTYQECADYIRTFCTTNGNNYPNIRLLPFANSVGDGATSEIDPVTGKHVQIQLNDHERGLVGTQQLIELIKSDIEVAQGFPGMAGEYESAGFTSSEGLCGNLNGVFTKFPLYHALKTFGPALQQQPDVLNIEALDEERLISLAMKWGGEDDTRLGFWFINKLPENRTIEVNVPESPELFIVTTRRFSVSELTNPVVSGIASVDGDTLSIEMVPYSTVYVEVAVSAWESDLILLNQAIGGPIRNWLYLTTQPINQVTRPGHFTEADGLQIGDYMDIICTDSLDPDRRTIAERYRMVVKTI